MAKTIYTYLHNDSLDGSRIVSMDGCMCKLYSINRDDSEFLKDFDTDLKRPALYILLNKNNRKAYIGETDDFSKRISQHIIKKEFWDEVYAFLGSTDDTLSKTEVQQLEYLAFHKAAEINAYDLSENTQSPKSPHMSVIQKAKTNTFFEYVQVLAMFAGCDIFERKTNSMPKTTIQTAIPKILPVAIKYTSDDLKGRTNLSLNGEGCYSKREMVLQIVKQFMKTFPDTTFDELRTIFIRDYLQRFSQYEFLQPDIEKARNWKELGENHVHYFIEEEDVIVSGDGVRFVVCVEWDKNNIINVLGIAQALGWDFEIV